MAKRQRTDIGFVTTCVPHIPCARMSPTRQTSFPTRKRSTQSLNRPATSYRHAHVPTSSTRPDSGTMSHKRQRTMHSQFGAHGVPDDHDPLVSTYMRSSEFNECLPLIGANASASSMSDVDRTMLLDLISTLERRIEHRAFTRYQELLQENLHVIMRRNASDQRHSHAASYIS